jgi:hypothetical protein
VPYLEASGGVNPASSAWAPKSWLKTLLSPAAFADPNAYLMNVAFSGKAADLAAGKYPANMIDTAARLVIWFENAAFGKDNAVMCSHSDWQSNRSDPGAGVIDKILARYSELKNPAPAPVNYKALYEAELAKVATQTKVIADLKTQLATANTKISAAKAALG